MKRTIAVIIALAVCVPLVRAQADEAVLKVNVFPPAGTLKPGSTFELTLELVIRAPYHVNSDQPSEDFLIGTTVDFKPRPGVKFGRIDFPSSTMKKFGFSDKLLSIFEGTVRVKAEISLAADFKDKILDLEGSVGYQACDDQSCLAPTEAPFKKALPVAGTAAPAEAAARTPEQKTKEAVAPVSPEKKGAIAAEKPSAESSAKAEIPVPGGEPAVSEKPAPATATAPAAPAAGTVKGIPGADFGSKGLPLTFLLVFLGGLALNLTPCIYPIIPITISYFGGQAGGRKGGVVLHSFVYVIGMAVTYSLLGILAAFTGSLFGSALQNPIVLVVIALIMIALALSMFDVYEFRMPQFLNKAAGGSQKGLFGSFFMGLTVGIIAAPCIGPFVLGLLTYVGNRGNVVLGFSLFFVLALGLGVPFLLLGIFSGSINKIPRSGAWMVWVRKIFGFILVGMALYFLKTLFPDPLYYSLSMAVVALAAGIYMAWIEPTPAAGKVFPFIRNVAGIVFLVLAVLFAAGGVRSAIDESLTEKLKDLAAEGGGITLNAVSWTPYSEANLAEALRQGRPVFIDTDAEWCIACHEMAQKVFTRPEVIALSRKFVMLKADVTFGKDPAVKAYYKRFNVKGAPTMIWIKPDGTELPELRGVGYEDKDVFLGKMKAVLDASAVAY